MPLYACTADWATVLPVPFTAHPVTPDSKGGGLVSRFVRFLARSTLHSGGAVRGQVGVDYIPVSLGGISGILCTSSWHGTLVRTAVVLLSDRLFDVPLCPRRGCEWSTGAGKAE